MKKTKWAAMAAAMLFLVSAYLGTSPALARYLNSEQLFAIHTPENRSLTVEVGATDSGNFLTTDGAAFLVAAPTGGKLPFTFTNNDNDAKVIRISSQGSTLGAESVFILNPSADIDQDKITDPVVSGTISTYTQTHTVNWTLAAGTYTVSIEVFEAADVKITGAKEDTTDPENPDTPSDNTGDNSGDNTDETSETENTPAAQSAATAASVTAEDGEGDTGGDNSDNSGDGDSSEGDTTPATPSNPITPAEDNKVSIEDTAVPCLTLRAVFVVQTDGSAPSVTVAPLLAITGNKHSINGTNQLSVVADAAVNRFTYSVQRYVELEQKGTEVDAKGNPIITKVLRWQTIELTAPTEGTTEIPAIEGFTAKLQEKTLTITNAESQAPAGLYRLVINLNDTTDFPLYVPFLVNYRQPILQVAQEEPPTVVI